MLAAPCGPCSVWSPDEMLYGWLWRVPFLASVVLIAVALFIRLRLGSPRPSSNWKSTSRLPSTRCPSCSEPRAGRSGGASDCGWPRTAAPTCSAPCRSPSSPPAPWVSANRSARSRSRWPRASASSQCRWPERCRTDSGRIPVYRTGAIFLTLLALPAWYLLSLGNPVLVVVVVVLGRQHRGEHHARRTVRDAARTVRKPAPLHRRRGIAGVLSRDRRRHRAPARRLVPVHDRLLLVAVGSLHLRAGHHHRVHHLHHPGDPGPQPDPDRGCSPSPAPKKPTRPAA